MNPPIVPDTAPFSVEQRAWLNGFLAGMFSSQAGGPEEAKAEAKPITILWGSQTGNSEALARRVSKTLGAKGFAPTVHDLSDYPVSKLTEESLVLVITSTYGDGEPPDNAAAFYSDLLGDGAPRLDTLKYSVLALGDSNYPDFCKCGSDIDLRLKELGASAFVERVDCDVDYDDAFDDWLKAVESAAGSVASGDESRDPMSQHIGYGKKNPFPAKVLTNYNLNAEDSAKETRHVEFSLEGSGLSYEAGDALAVMPLNDARYVSDFLQASGFRGDEEVEGSTLREVLIERYDVTNLTLKRVKRYAELSGSQRLAELAEDKEAFKAFAWGRQLIDLFAEAPLSLGQPRDLLELLGKLAPRLYSISSSPKAHRDEVHVTVGVVRYEAHGRARQGVCSNFLANQGGDSRVRIYFHHTKTFKLPEDPALPVIMVGPGTGIAPFRAFLEERSATGATGDNWLFFGDQHVASDFLYEEQLQGYLETGALRYLDTAFSRDQEQKVYVQDRMRERGGELYRWLEAGAYFYVCGDASRMAKDVDKALHDVIAEQGETSTEEAAAYVEDMKKSKRYLRDVY